MRVRVDEITIGTQGPIQALQPADEEFWDAAVGEVIPPPPPGEFQFPWWLVGIVGVGVVAIARKREMDKK